MMRRGGVTAQYAKLEMRRRTTLIAAMLLRKGAADGMICGTISTTSRHLEYIDRVIGKRKGNQCLRGDECADLAEPAAFHRRHPCEPRPDRRAALRDHAAWPREVLRRFGLEPKIALLSHSNFGSHDDPSALKMRRTLELLREQHRCWRSTARCTATARSMNRSARKILPDTTLTGPANLLVMPNLGRREHRLQSAEDGGWQQRRCRPDPARLRRARAHPHALRHCSTHRERDCTHRDGGERIQAVVDSRLARRRVATRQGARG